MKTIIPVAGVGSRLRPHTHTHPKALIPVAGKPILSHIVDSFVDAGVEDFVFVIGYLGDKIQSYINDNYPYLNCEFVWQTSREGIGHAVWEARDSFKDEDEVLIALGDTIFEMDLQAFMNLKYSAVATKKVEDPRRFGVVEPDVNGFIEKVVEKPNIPKSNLAIVGVYKLKEIKDLLSALEEHITNDIRTQNEFHLTDAIQEIIENGAKIQSFPIGNWFDCGKKETLIETNSTLLKKPGFSSNGKHEFENTIIIEPVSIASDCQISESIIGPYVSIGEGAIVNKSIIKNSIIGPFAQIEKSLLDQSIMGNDAQLKGVFQSLNIGDSTEINFE